MHIPAITNEALPVAWPSLNRPPVPVCALNSQEEFRNLHNKMMRYTLEEVLPQLGSYGFLRLR